MLGTQEVFVRFTGFACNVPKISIRRVKLSAPPIPSARLLLWVLELNYLVALLFLPCGFYAAPKNGTTTRSDGRGRYF